MTKLEKNKRNMSNLNPATHPKCAAQSLESCLSLRNPMEDSPPGSSVTGILHARTVEWVAIYFSSVSSIHRDQTLFLCLLHWQEGSLPLAPPSQVHKGLNCFLVCLQLDTSIPEKRLDSCSWAFLKGRTVIREDCFQFLLALYQLLLSDCTETTPD